MRLSFLAATLLLLSMNNPAFAQVQCSDIFTNGASINSDSGSLTLGWLSGITGGSAVLDTPALSDNSGWNACSGSACVSSGSAAASSSPTFQTGSQSDGNIDVGFGMSETHPAGDYRNVTVNSEAQLTFSTVDGTYYMRNADIGYRSSLILSPGDYWIDRNLTFGTEATIAPASAGTVRIFVDGNVTFNSSFDGSAFAPENLLIYATGRISVESQAVVNGFLYSASGNSSLGYQSVVNGGISAFRLDFNSEAQVSFDSSGLAGADFEPFCSNVITIPDPVAEYLLDESSWAGTAGEVQDSSGNGIDGHAVSLGGLPSTDESNPAIAGDPGTCGYGQFNGTSDGYVEIPDPGPGSLLDFTSEFSVAVWIYPVSLPSSGLMTIVSKDTNSEFHLNPSGQVNWWWGGGDQELTSTGTVSLNAWNHIVITYESGNQVIYVNGSGSGANNSVSALTTNNNSMFIGTDWNFHSRRFTGLIDEVKIYDSALSAVQVAAVRDQTHECTASDPLTHYRIDHSGSAVTCRATNVTITPHSASHISPVPDATGSIIDISATSLTPGWISSGATWSLVTGTPANFTALPNGQAQYQFASAETSVVLGLANISEASIDIDVNDGIYTDVDGDAVEDQLLTFADSGFVFYEDADNDGNGDGTPIASSVVSGGVSTPSIIQAVRTDTNTGACIAGATGTYSVQIAYECINPTNCQLDRDLEINGTAIQENNSGNVIDYQDVSLTFDSDGEAPLVFEYFDVGMVRLHARLSLEANAKTLQGTSGATVAYPADLLITDVTTAGGSPNPGTTTTGNGFVPAGTAFNVYVEARNADGRITPNYGLEISPEPIQLNTSSLIMPAGGSLPNLNAASAFTPTATLGRFVNASVNWSEAGTIVIYAGNDDYLGAGAVTGSASGNIGRFYPEFYTLNGDTLTEGCAAGGFTWMSDQLFSYQPLVFNFSINAVSASMTTLTNYDATLGYPVGSIITVAENNNSGTDLSARAFITSGTFAAGVYNITNGSGGFARLLSTGEIPDGPFTSLQFGLLASGGVDNLDFQSSDLSMHAGQNNNCVTDGDCNAAAIASPLEVRFGRLYGLNAHGPEAAPLHATLHTQYWNGSEFVQNVNDVCTQINFADVSFAGNSLSTDANRSVALGGGTTTGTFTSFVPGTNFLFINGDSGLQFSAAGSGNTGSFNVDFDLSNYGYLRSDWNNNGDYSDDTVLPSMEIQFGRYRGHDRIIHWREILN